MLPGEVRFDSHRASEKKSGCRPSPMADENFPHQRKPTRKRAKNPKFALKKP